MDIPDIRWEKFSQEDPWNRSQAYREDKGEEEEAGQRKPRPGNLKFGSIIYLSSFVLIKTWIMTDSGSWVLRKKTVPSSPMQREHNPVDAINRDLLPAMFTTILPIVAPIT